MQMEHTPLEVRVTALERQVRKLQAELKMVRQESQAAWWERLAGKFKDDPLFDEVVEAGQTYRRSLSPRSRS